MLSYTEPVDVDSFTLDAPVTKSGATITYGPFSNVPGSTNKDFVSEHQKRITVHYAYDLPLLEIPTMKRAAEISHWGSNLNIEDIFTFTTLEPVRVTVILCKAQVSDRC